MMSNPAYLSPRAVADLLGMHERSVRRWIADGKLPSHRLAGARLVARADLERLLDTQLDLDDGSDSDDK